MGRGGWIKVHRKMLDNPIVCKDGDHLAVWAYLLLSATHQEQPALFKGEKITLKPGQLITGRKSIAEKLSINESKVKRVLKLFESDQQIDRQSSNQNSLITILQWDDYQTFDRESDQRMTNERPTDDQRVTTNKNVKNDKNEKKYVYSAPARPDTHPFGKLGNVLLTDEEYQDITETYESPLALIDKLSLWLPEHPEVTNHFAKVLKFAVNDNWPRRPKRQKEELPVPKRAERAPADLMAVVNQITKTI